MRTRKTPNTEIFHVLIVTEAGILPSTFFMSEIKNEKMSIWIETQSWKNVSFSVRNIFQYDF